MFQLIFRKFGNRLQTKDDLLSGLTVALALVPEAVAFAIIAGVTPIIGLYAAFMVCLITAVLGGRPGMISGATGALAVIMVSLVLLGNERGEALGLGPDLGHPVPFCRSYSDGNNSDWMRYFKTWPLCSTDSPARDVWICERTGHCHF